MRDKNEEKDLRVKIQEIDTTKFNLRIPECCLEGWESCPHTIKKQRKNKTNPAL